MLPFSIYRKGRYRLIKIDEDVAENTELSELTFIVKGMLDQGKRTIAVRFTPRSFFGTKAVHDFVDCLEMVTEKQGKLAVVNPNKYIHNFLDAIDFDHVVDVCDNEEDLVCLDTIK